jgi:hypothetical protein
MTAQSIKEQVDASFKATETLAKQAQPGSIIRVAPRVFVLVVSKCRFGRESFYYVPCRKDGTIFKQYGDTISAANYINNSVMLSLGNRNQGAKIVGHVELKKRVVFNNCRKYEWHETGDVAIDNYMSHLDQRWTLFSDTATDLEMRRHARDEDRNFHSENADMISDFAQLLWMRKCRDANLMRLRREYQSRGGK